MKYAQEIIDLMGAYPGREFQMREGDCEVCCGEEGG